jgi:hypothetical protein
MPRIKTTPMVRIALWALRVYLLILLSLIGMKFVRMLAQSRSSEGTATVPARPEKTAKPAQ